MAITTNASYIPTTDEFIEHWGLVNEARVVGSPFVLRTGLAKAGLEALRTGLLGIETALQARLNDGEVARTAINREKAELLMWFGRFMEVFDGYFGDSDLAGARPLAPVVSISTENFLRPMGDAADLWNRINAGDPVAGIALPLLVVGQVPGQSCSQEAFGEMMDGLRESAKEEALAEARARQERSRRNHAQGVIYDALKLYRQAMPTALPGQDALQDTLPKLTPEAGHTPQAVSATAVWVAGTTSKTTYGASEDADLKEYQLRGVIGAVWSDDDAVTLATNEPEDAREFTVDFGLTAPGTHIVLKVFVVTQDGNERGSAPLPVLRPEGS